jgi:hypothetical protein
MKRVIREAAEKGYDKVAWTPGSVQADRYDLSKHVDEIHYDPKSELLAHKNKGTDTWNENDVPKDRLANYIGKDAAEKLLNSEPNKYPNGDDYYSLKGIDLKVGGEGMKGFYDQILPATVNKLVKKHGGKVETSQLKGATEATTENLVKSGRDVVIDHGDVRDPSETIKVRDRDTDKVLFETKDYDAAKKFAAEYRLPPVPVHSIDITPSLRAAAMKGFPLFSAGGVAATGMMGDLAKQDDYR